MLTTIVKAGQVLDLFTRERPEWGVTEIARELNFPKSNAHDIASTLVYINLLQRTGQSRYRLGWRLTSLAAGVVLEDSLRQHAPAVMGQLAAETGQTTHLAVWDGRRLMFLARKLGRRGLDQPHARAGSRLLAHCTASGKVLLAGRPWDEVIERVGANDGDALDFRTPRSVRDMRRLRGELDRVRECGIGYNVGETDLDVAALAVPVHDATGHAVVALGITVALSEFTSFRARYEPLLRSMGQTLTRHLVTADRGRLRPVGASAVEWAPTTPETAGSIKVAG